MFDFCFLPFSFVFDAFPAPLPQIYRVFARFCARSARKLVVFAGKRLIFCVIYGIMDKKGYFFAHFPAPAGQICRLSSSLVFQLLDIKDKSGRSILRTE